jgi:hypothetical protein
MAEPPVLTQVWRFVCKGRSCKLRCNHNLPIFLKFFYEINIK